VAAAGIPADRAETLRRALAATFADPEFVATAKAQNLMLETGGASEITNIAEEVLKAPEAVRLRARAVIDALSGP
jgi:tripartite-type tricarboxylate transporter receptor subunit TctC